MCERGGALWWFGGVVKVAGFAGWLAGRWLKAAVSRQREYLADARAVQWTRSKDGLGSVLRKVMGQRQAAEAQPVRAGPPCRAAHAAGRGAKRQPLGLDN